VVLSVGSAVHAACTAARDILVSIAREDPASPLDGAPREAIVVEDGWLGLRGDPRRRESAAALITRHGAQAIEVGGSSAPGAEAQRVSMNSFGAVYVQVNVDPEFGLLRVPRVVGAYGVGRVINAKTARSQLMGGIVWGLSLALMEQSVLDMRSGRFVNAQLADYHVHVPVNADIGQIETIIVPEHDEWVNPLGPRAWARWR
jgi:xanthine dehydrogenase YagR molybdenum-binding subunit